jgi:nitrogen fixation protein FixH
MNARYSNFTADERSRGRFAARRWTTAIVIMLAFPLFLVSLVVYLTAGDPGFRVIPGYEQRAATHDAIARRRVAATASGMQVDVALRGEGSASRLEVSLTDAAGQPVDGLVITLEAFHVARSAHAVMLAMEPAGSGRYAAPYLPAAAGYHVFALEIRRGAEILDFEVRRWLDSGGVGAG